MPRRNRDEAQAFWHNTQDKVRPGDYGHVLPKAKNATDTTPTPQDDRAKKYCYWLN